MSTCSPRPARRSDVHAGLLRWPSGRSLTLEPAACRAEHEPALQTGAAPSSCRALQAPRRLGYQHFGMHSGHSGSGSPEWSINAKKRTSPGRAAAGPTSEAPRGPRLVSQAQCGGQRVQLAPRVRHDVLKGHVARRCGLPPRRHALARGPAPGQPRGSVAAPTRARQPRDWRGRGQSLSHATGAPMTVQSPDQGMQPGQGRTRQRMWSST